MYKLIKSASLEKHLIERFSLKSSEVESFFCVRILNAATNPVRLLIYNSSELGKAVKDSK